MATIRELLTKILFRTDATGLKKVETNTNAMKRQMRSASRAAHALKRDLRGIGRGVKTMVAAVVAGRIAKLFTTDFAKSTDEAIKFSKALGISLESYLGLTHAVKLSGGEVADMQKALGQLSKRSLEVTQGNKTMGKIFDQIGVKVTDGSGKLRGTTDVLLDLADKFKAMPDGMKKTGLAMQLFGRTGQKLIPMFNEGKAGIKGMMEEAKRLGIVLSKDQAKIAEEYNDEMLRAGSILVGLRNTISLRVLPAITRNIRAFQLWAREGDNLKRMINGLIVAAKALAVVFAMVAAVKFGQTMGTIALATKRAALWTRTLGAAQMIAYAKFFLVAAAIAAVVLVIQDLYTYAKGGTSAIGKLLERFAPAAKIRGVLNEIGGALKRLGMAVLQLGRDMLPVVISAFKRLIPIGIALVKGWVKLQMALIKVARVLWREFGPVIEELGTALVKLFEELWPVVEEGARIALTAAMELGRALLELWRAVWPEIKALARTGHELLKALVVELKSVWKEIKPAIDTVISAMGDLWVTAKPVVEMIIAGSLKMSKLFGKIAKAVLPHLGKQFKTTFKVIAMVITASIKQLVMFIKMVTFAVGKIREAYNMMLALLGLQKVGVAGVGAAVTAGEVATLPMPLTPAQAMAATPARATTKQLNIGSLAVTVQGTTGMSPEEMVAAMKEALQGTITDTFTSFAPAL